MRGAVIVLQEVPLLYANPGLVVSHGVRAGGEVPTSSPPHVEVDIENLSPPAGAGRQSRKQNNTLSTVRERHTSGHTSHIFAIYQQKLENATTTVAAY